MQLRRMLDRFLGRRAFANPPIVLDARNAQPDPAIITLISVVLSTAPKTFTGAATFVTMTGDRTAAVPVATSRASSNDDDDDQSAQTTTTPVKATASSSKLPLSTPSTTSKVSSSNIPSTTSDPLSVAQSATASPEPTQAAASGGMSGGAKAGLAFGIMLLIALVGGAIFMFYRRRKERLEDRGATAQDVEKDFLSNSRNPDALPAHAAPASGAAAGGFGAYAEKNAVQETESDRNRFSYEGPANTDRELPPPPPLFKSSANPPTLPAFTSTEILNGMPFAAAAGGVGYAAAQNKSQSSQDMNNPFGNHAKTDSKEDIPSQVAPNPRTSSFGIGIQAADFPLPESSPPTPSVPTFQPFNAQQSQVSLASNKTNGPSAASAAAAAAGAAAIMAATAAAASNKPQGAAPNQAPPTENVHRVQLDFNPSMDDELHITAGELTRILHEYDDGWALCIKMDRSAQGVVPRTCLSKHPVKPRPQSPRPGPGGPNGPSGPPMRGPAPPFAQPPRSQSPGAGGRNSPAPRNGNTAPYAQQSRPLTPTQRGPAAGPRAMQDSPSRIPAPAGAVPTRKPVGQS